jgi:hypothetical protein
LVSWLAWFAEPRGIIVASRTPALPGAPLESPLRLEEDPLMLVMAPSRVRDEPVDLQKVGALFERCGLPAEL